MEKMFISYEEYGKLIQQLTEKILNSKIFEKINALYCPPRGGLPIGVHLSHHLNIPLHQTINWFYFDKNYDELLVIDDIADTGKTLNDYSIFKSATLFYKPRTIVTPDFFVDRIENEIWVIFPWEKSDEIPNR